MASLRAVREIHVQHTSEGADKVKRELDQQTAANDRLAQSSESVAKVTETTARRQQSALGAYERQRASMDATYRAQQQFERGLRTIDRALEQGIIGAQQYARDLDQLRTRQLALSTANDNSARSASRHAAELSNLRAAFDPAYASARRMAEEVDSLARLEREGIQIAGGYEAALQGIITKYDEAGQAARKAAEANAAFIQSARDAQAAENARQIAESNQGALNRVLGVRGPAQGVARSSASVFEEDAAALDRLRSQLNPVGEAQARLASEVERYERWARQGQITTDDLTTATAESRKRFDEFRTSLEKGGESAGGLFDSLRGFASRVNPLLATVGASLSVGAVVAYADSWSDMQSRVGAAVRNMEVAPLLMERLVDIANASYSPLSQTVEVFSRNVTVMRDMGRSANDAADFTKSLNNALVITATRGQNATSVQDALSRAMATGKLQADGLETVLTNGGAVAEALAAELGTNVNGLRAFATAGKITGDVIADALIKRLVEMQERAAEMPSTVGDAFVRLGTNLSAYIGQMDQSVGASSRLSGVLLTIADNIDPIARAATVAGVAVTASFAPAILAGIATGFTAIGTAGVGAMTAIGAAAALNPIGALAAALVTVVAAFYLFRDEIASVLGVDLVDVAHRTANEFIGLFVGAYEGVEEAWSRLPNFMSGIGKLAWNALIEEFEKPALTVTLPGLGEKVLIPGLDLSALKSDLNTVETMDVGKVFDRVKVAVGRNYIGSMAEAAGWTRTAEDAVADLNAILDETPGAAAGAGEALTDAQKKAADAFADQIRALEQSTEAQQRQIDMFGATAGATAAAELRARELARAWDVAREAGLNALPKATTTAIDNAAASVESLTNQLQRMNLERGQSEALRMLEAEAGLIGMSAEARKVAMAGLSAEAELRRQNISTTDEQGAAYVRNAQSLAAGRIEIDRQTAAYEKQHQFVENVLSTSLDALFDTGKAESWGDAVLGVFADIGRQFQELAKQNLMQALFGQNYTAGQLAPGQRSIAQPVFPAGFGAAPVAANQNLPASAFVPTPTAATRQTTQRLAEGVTTAVSRDLLSNMLSAGKSQTHVTGLNTEFAVAMTNMFSEAPAAVRSATNIYSGFRSVERQAELFQGAVAKYGSEAAARKWVAPPGNSQHNKGMAADLSYGNSAARQWIHANAGKYGLAFPLGHENWHIELAGARRGGARSAAQAVSTVSGGNLSVPQYAAPQGMPYIDGGYAGYGQGGGIPLPTARPGSSQGGNGWFGRNGKIANFMQSPMGQMGMLGIGAFGTGYSSGSTGGGALQGGLTGFMTGGPIGGLVGLVGGALGGLFGGRQKRKQEHQARAQEWAQMAPQWTAFQDEARTGTGATSNLRANQVAMADQLTEFVRVGSAAWKNGSNNSSALFSQTGSNLGEYFKRTNAAFAGGFDANVRSLGSGQGMESPFLQARDSIIAMGKDLLTFVDDARFVFGDGSEQLQRATEASVAQLRAMVSGGTELTEVGTALEVLAGAGNALGNQLMQLGLSFDDAAREVGDAAHLMITRIRGDFVQGIQDQIDTLDGKAYVADFRELISGVDLMLKDAAALGVDRSLVDNLFAKQAQSIINGAELTGSAFADLIVQFPRLAGVVVEFAAAAEEAAQSIEDALNAAAQQGLEQARGLLERSYSAEVDRINEVIRARRDEISEFERSKSAAEQFKTSIRTLLDDMLTDPNLSPLSAQDRLGEAERQYRETLAKAMAGDDTARGDLASDSQRYLDEARSFWASSEQYGAIFESVRKSLEGAEAKAGLEITEAQRQIERLETMIKADEASLTIMQEQYNALLKIDTSVVALADAMKHFAAMRTLAEDAAAKAGASTGLSRSQQYLANNTDVLSAVAGGYTFGLPSGSSLDAIVKAHFDQFGQFEGRKYAMGGLVSGPGSGTSDSIRAMLSNGEYVVPAARVPANLPALEAMRVGRPVTPSADNGNRELVDEVRALRQQVVALTRVSADGSLQVKGSVETGNRIAQTSAATAKRKAAA